MLLKASLFFVIVFGVGLLPFKVSIQQTKPMVFVGTTPCSQGTRPLPGIAKDAACELIKWELKLHIGNYILDCDYGLPQNGTKGPAKNVKHLHREGKWIAVKGTKIDPAAIIYYFDPETPSASFSFLRLSENLIHLLDSRQQLMIGNGACGYTLNRIMK